MKKGIIILGSSRSEGDTAIISTYLKDKTGYDLIDLNQFDIGYFNYDFKNDTDDFNGLFKKIVKEYDTLLLATPIYWYTMSGIMKVFLDRISDFLYKEKEYGRMLREARVWQ